MGVIPRADDTARLAIVQNIRWPPSRRPCGSSEREPEACAAEGAVPRPIAARAEALAGELERLGEPG